MVGDESPIDFRLSTFGRGAFFYLKFHSLNDIVKHRSIFIFSLHKLRIFLRHFYRSICTLFIKRSMTIAKFSYSYFTRGQIDGYCVSTINRGVLRGDCITDHRLRSIEGTIMSWIYLLSGGLTLAVFIYLVVALFYPEKF